ncbi:hypothetical protein D922_01257 [Enterococcus faecalis 06-MB-DW-09]|nr:hypothetical protein D922_01257 [Enterococcus faecalis 06-MB-DW-09]
MKMGKRVYSDFEGGYGVAEEPILGESETAYHPAIDKETAEKLITEIQLLRKDLEGFRFGTETKKS